MTQASYLLPRVVAGLDLCASSGMQNPLNPGYWLSEDLRCFGFRAVGENVSVSKLCQVVGPENIEIGDNVRIDAFTSLVVPSGFIRLGSYIHIGTGCMLGGRGGITFDDFSGLSHNVQVFSASDDVSGEWLPSCSVPGEFTKPTVRPVHFSRHAMVGSGSVLLPGAALGEGTVLGTSSLARRPLRPWSIYFGSPAKRIADRKMRILDLEAQVRAGRQARMLPPAAENDAREVRNGATGGDRRDGEGRAAESAHHRPVDSADVRLQPDPVAVGHL